MACAADMAKAGCAVTVYEAFHLPGGVLRYGIPDFRLPNAVVDAEIDALRRLGVRFECNTLVGRLFTIEQMIDELGYDAVFIGTGAGYPAMLGIPGRFAERRAVGQRTADPLQPDACARLPAVGHAAAARPPRRRGRRRQHRHGRHARRLRLGAEQVSCIYRRSRAECPARAEEVHHAEQEGIEFHWLTAPVEVLGDASGERARRCAASAWNWASPTAPAGAGPVPVPGSEHEIEVDQVVFAIGTNANPIIGQTSGLALNERGYIAVDDNLATSLAGVWAGGDIVTGAATVIEAMGAGRRAAAAMKACLGLADPAPGRAGRRSRRHAVRHPAPTSAILSACGSR